VDIPVGYGLLVKSLVTVEGVSRGLYPDIDLMTTAGPFVTRVLARSAVDPIRLGLELPVLSAAVARSLLR
jgi:predicted unusual protein kinase regulating ubiquinone biosynthesis (AarF/ABC1/UbiB family)